MKIPHFNQVNSFRKEKQGSALMTVLLTMGVVSILSASLLRLGVQEVDFNGRRAADIQAKHVVESAIEIAMAKLEASFKETQSISASTPTITLSGPETSLLLSNARFVTGVRIVSVTNQLLRQRVYVDENDQDTLLDPHRGAFVNVSEWDVRAEVDVNYRGQTRVIQASQRFQVRESPFFTHAIFYNMDLEFHPGAIMEINGPVHTNGNIWLLGTRGRGIYFMDKVSATKTIRVGTMTNAVGPNGEVFQDDWSDMTRNNGSPDDHTRKDGVNVWFNTNGVRPPGSNGVGYKVRSGITYGNLYDGYGDYMTKDAYYDSLSASDGRLADGLGFTNHGEFLANRFDGNLVAGSGDAPNIRPQFIPNYVAEDGSGIGRNSGYSLIEPLMAGSDSGGGMNSGHKGEAEKEKFAYKAGLTLKVVYSPDSAPSAPNAVQLVRKDGERDNPNHLTDYYLVAQKTRRSNAHDMDTTDTSGSPTFPVLDDDGNAVLDDDGDPVVETIEQTNADDVFIDPEVVDEMFSLRLYDEDGDGKPRSRSGIYDQRRKKPLDLIEVDMEKFRTELVEAPNDNRFHNAGSATFTPQSDYNGVVYVEFPITNSYTTREDKIAVARDEYRTVDLGGSTSTSGLGLLVTNAERLPDPSYNATKAPGFTLATNGTAYIKGNYNADGNMSTGSSADGDGEGSQYNTLAAIAADSITFLSDAFDFRRAKDNPNNRDAVSTEVNAALMSGIVPTNKPGVDYNDDGSEDMILSGGSHNYPRFLEDWGGKTFRYRGSMVAFFESEIAVAPQEQVGHRYYGAPNREYGFFEVFGTGSQPPGTPMGRTFFKLDFRFL